MVLKGARAVAKDDGEFVNGGGNIVRTDPVVKEGRQPWSAVLLSQLNSGSDFR
jgi:hypothetical protein